MTAETKEVITLVLPETVATRSYPFSRQTLDQIKELRHNREEDLFDETGKEHMVPAPVVLAEAVDLLHRTTFPE